MPDHSVHKATDFAPDERLIVERWLGRSLSDNETVSVNAYRPHPAPCRQRKEALRHEILEQAREIGSRAGNLITDEENGALVDGALVEIRRQRR